MSKENNTASIVIESAPGLSITSDHQVEHNAQTGVTVITHEVTIRQEAQRVVDETGAEGGSFSVVVEHQGGQSESISGPDAPELFQNNPITGAREERPLPEGSTVRVERSARGAWMAA